MSAADSIEDALERLEVVSQRLEVELRTYCDVTIDWTLKTADIFDQAKERRASDKWAEVLAAKQFPDLWADYKRAESAVKASEKQSTILGNLIKGYQTQNANERELTR